MKHICESKFHFLKALHQLFLRPIFQPHTLQVMIIASVFHYGERIFQVQIRKSLWKYSKRLCTLSGRHGNWPWTSCLNMVKNILYKNVIPVRIVSQKCKSNCSTTQGYISNNKIMTWSHYSLQKKMTKWISRKTALK